MFTLSLSERKLHLAALLYLSIPCILFLIGWVTPYLTLPLIAAIIFTITRALRHEGEVWQIRPLQLIQLAVIFLFLSLPLITDGLVGGFPTDWDIRCFRQAMYRNLIDAPWPVILPDGRELTYYLSGFLPAALISRLTTSHLLQQWFFMLWSILGVFLATLFFLHKWKKITWLFILLFIFMADPLWHCYSSTYSFPSGMRYIVFLLQKHYGIHLAVLSDVPMFQTLTGYKSSICACNSLPGTLLAVSMMIHVRRMSHILVPLIMAFLMFLSPLGAIGCFLFAAVSYFRNFTFTKESCFRRIPWLITPILLVLICAVYTARGEKSTDICAPWTMWGIISFLLIYFHILAVAFFFILPLSKKILFGDIWLRTTLLSIILVPLLYIGTAKELSAGHFNELWLKTYPALTMIIAASLVQYWSKANAFKYAWLIWCSITLVFYLFSSVYSFNPSLRVFDEWNGHVCHIQPIMKQKIPDTHSPIIDGVLIKENGQSERLFPGCLLPKAPGCDYTRPHQSDN